MSVLPIVAPRPPAVAALVAQPDEEADERPRPLFVPDEDLAAWVNEHFLGAESPLLNVDHGHLVEASVGFLWTNVLNADNSRGGRPILGTAQLGQPTGKPWPTAMAESQRRRWFGEVPDFLITLYAPWAATADAAALLAVIDHELYHCAQKERDGEPVYNEWTGEPVWTMRGHDVEQFVGVVERYGARASGVERLVWAAGQAPSVARADLDFGCGNCLRR